MLEGRSRLPAQADMGERPFVFCRTGDHPQCPGLVGLQVCPCEECDHWDALATGDA